MTLLESGRCTEELCSFKILRRPQGHTENRVRESWYRAHLGNCHGPTSRQTYLGNLKRFGGSTANEGAGQVVASGWGKGFYTYIDTKGCAARRT